MRRVSVSNLDFYRVWRADEDMDLGMLLERLQGRFQQTPAMKAGEAFHKALENWNAGYATELNADGYIFDVQCDADIVLPSTRELKITKQYGELTVSGRVDCLIGRVVIDHKTTAQFDADRLMSGYQWRYYLDMLDAAEFWWNVFVLKEGDDDKHYIVTDFHRLEQRRYPELHADCESLAAAFSAFANEHLAVRA